MFTRGDPWIKRASAGLIVWAIGAVLVSSAQAAAAEAVDAERLEQLKQKATAVESYRADFVLVVKDEKEPVTLKGNILYQKPDKRRVDFDNAGLNEDVAEVVVSDGLYEWQYFPQRKTVYKTDWAKIKSAGIKDQSFELRGLHQPFIDVKPESVRFLGTKIEGKEALETYEADPADALVADAPFQPGKVKILISPGDGLTRQLSMTDAQGNEVLNQKYTKVQTGVPIKPTEFDFKPPQDAEIVDISQDRMDAAHALDLPPEEPWTGDPQS
ncbi:MAG: outer membrane lipoprotein carrier protein LolA [Candidatus Omnitrophica bacterium]|nr:outer membrane lipoprotein carrier protein LolA [Candidatus Omnitrophota bacterium]